MNQAIMMNLEAVSVGGKLANFTIVSYWLYKYLAPTNLIQLHTLIRTLRLVLLTIKHL